jgi:hypothetical protein
MAVIEARGYKLCNVPGTIQNESYYYYKGFEYPENLEDAEPGYQIIFLVWDRRNYPDSTLPDEYTMGVTPLILTSNYMWPRIDIQMTKQNFAVSSVELFAKNIYKAIIHKS